jgi:hypothetical protein
MANKYIWHGQTYCGDGTTSDAAASNGAAGAWNDINVFMGTAPAYGALISGDVVYIRSKDASAADISVVFSTNSTLGSSVATTGAWVQWVLDNGTVWPGIDGVLTFSTSGNYALTCPDYNMIEARTRGALIIKTTETSAGSGSIFVANNSVFNGIKIDTSIPTSGFGRKISIGGTGTVFDGCDFLFGIRYNCGLIISPYTHLVLINPSIELTTAAETDPVFLPGNYGSTYRVIGGRIFGAGAQNGQLVFGSSGSNGSFFSTGFKIPNTMALAAQENFTSYSENETSAIALGADESVGAMLVKHAGVLDSRNDGYYPYLNAALPNSTATGWSWKAYPKYAWLNNALDITTQKVYTGDDSILTVSIELLVSTTFAAIDKKNCVLSLSYVDAATGSVLSAKSSGDYGEELDSSTAGWIAAESEGLPVYGAISFDKRKLSVSTSTAVKKDTAITCILRIMQSSTSANDILFVDPDVTLA